MPFTYFVTMKNGKTFQCNNVTSITIATPLVSNGTYRDAPPVVVGGSAGALGASASASVAGGVNPTVTLNSVLGEVEAVGASSVAQDDAYTHVVPRYLNSPIGLVFITTSAGIATAPTGATFSTTPPTVPAGTFSVIDCDCIFPLDEVLGIYNAAQPGYSPSRSIVTTYNEP